ncbi:MAG: thiol-activated cytolysin family protein [Bacteroidota bacterium]
MLRFTIIALLAFFAISCESDPENNPQPQSQSFKISEMKVLFSEQEIDNLKETEIDRDIIENRLCTKNRVEWEKSFDTNFLYDPFSKEIYLSSLLDAESIESGGYREIATPRATIKASVSLQSAGVDPSFEISSPTLSSVRTAINRKLQEYPSTVSSTIVTHKDYEIDDERKLKVALESSLKSPFASLSAGFNFNQERIKSRKLVRFVQEFYTIDMDALENPEDLFSDQEEAEAKLSSLAYSPVYVSSIRYGRIGVMMIESERSSSELSGALSASFAGTGEIEISSEYEALLNEATINILVVGSSGTTSVEPILGGFEGFKRFIKEGSEYSQSSPGAPIAYTLTNLVDGSKVHVKLSTDYEVESCTEEAIDFLDITESRCGQNPNDPLEASLDLDEGYVLTGIGVEVRRDGNDEEIHTIKAQMRKLFPNGMLGDREHIYWIDGKIKRDSSVVAGDIKLESWLSAKDNNIITYFAGSILDRDFNSLLLVQREIQAQSNGLLNLVNPDTLVYGDRLDTYEVGCPNFDQVQEERKNAILGIGMTANNKNVKTLRLKFGRLE